MKKIRMDKAEKAKKKAEMKLIYSASKEKYENYMKRLLNGDETVRSDIEIEKEVMKQIILDVNELKKL